MKRIPAFSFAELMAQGEAAIVKYPPQPLTPEIVAEHGRPGTERRLITWNGNAGIEPEKRLKEHVIVGAYHPVHPDSYYIDTRMRVVTSDHILYILHASLPLGTTDLAVWQGGVRPLVLERMHNKSFTYRNRKYMQPIKGELEGLLHGRVFTLYVG